MYLLPYIARRRRTQTDACVAVTVRTGWAFAILFAATVGAAQAPVAVQELTREEMAQAKITLRRDQDGKKVVMVVRGEQEIPLKTPDVDCAVGVVRGSGELVVLVGGVTTSLDLYLVQKNGEWLPYHTDGGRRLPRKFNDNSGSWPAIEGSHLFVFGYEKSGSIEFRAMNFAGQVLAERKLPATVEGWQMESKADEGDVVVRFGSGLEVLKFRHPLAPTLEVKPKLVQFGPVTVGSRSRQEVQFANIGKRPLELRIEPLQKGFEIFGDVPETLTAAQIVRVRIDFAPDREGPFNLQLRVTATGAVREHVVVLQGIGISVAEAAKAAAAKVAKAPGASGPPAAPQVLRATVHPRGDGRVLILGRVRPPIVGRIAVRTADGTRHGAGVDALGRFHLTVQADVGSKLEVGVVTAEDKRSPLVPLATVPAMLTVDKSTARIRCLPNEKFVLHAVLDGEVLRSWRGEADAMGRRSVPLSILGEGEGEGELAVQVTVIDGAQVRSSPAIPVR